MLAAGTLAGAQPPANPALRPLGGAAHVGDRVAVVNRVMLVSTPAEYLRALGEWTPTCRFPILFDDGTHLGRENIARFVRAFKPARVVRPADPAHPPAQPVSLGTPDETAAAITHALCEAWDMPDERTLHAAWRAGTSLPAGIVVFDPADASWPGALALAAGHGQLLVRFDRPATGGWAAGVDGAMTLTEASAVVALTSEVFKAWLPDQRRAGAMRAVTLCLNAPVRVQLAADESLPGAGPLVCKPGECVALSDLVGRFTKPGGQGAGVGASRWAVGGQVFGSHAQSAYRAMCALFLTADSAFVFDGYNAGPGFDDYDGTRAARALSTAGLKVELHDRPNNKPADWRAACAKPLDAGLVLINSHGMRDVFNLADQPATCGDVPELNRPAVVSVVHSWSAVTPGNRWTVAGRWLERGAYAYVGSVHEPYLAAFVPTPRVAESLGAGRPLGASVRMDSPPWRIALLGDPLACIVGTNAERVSDDAVGLPNVESAMADALKAKDFTQAMLALVLLGRDKDASRLAGALLLDQPDAVTMRVAAAAIGAAYRAGDLDTFFALLKVVLPALDWKYEHEYVDVPDMAWHAAFQQGLTLTDERVALLIPLIRTGGGGEALRDAMELYRVTDARHGKAAAKALLQRIADEATAPGVKQVISERLRSL